MLPKVSKLDGDEPTIQRKYASINQSCGVLKKSFQVNPRFRLNMVMIAKAMEILTS